MKLTLESLHKDHDNLRRVLYLLEQLLIDFYRGSFHDYPMLQRILAYIQDYPEQAHHPLEDEIFSRILDAGISDGKLRKNINALMKDHSELEVITRDAMHAIETMSVTGDSDISGIGNSLSALINRHRAHILFEEMNIYPYVKEHLDKKGWEKIGALVPCQEDPLFGDRVSKEYEHIFKAL